MNKVEKVITWTESKLLASRAHKNPEAVFSNLLKIQKKYARITRGEWGYTVFNCSYMANMANLAFMCLAQGKIPIMDFHAETEYPSNDWSTFFRQPFIWGGQELNMNDIESVNVTNGVYRISSRSIYNRDEIKLWGTLYNLLFVLNEKTEEYVQSEINNCIGSQSVLGVLVRGTDYTGTKPKGHPIQPDIEDVIREVRKEFGNGNYDAIYLATEEEQIYHKFNTEFPGMIITNRRVYYDSIYYANGLKLIGKVHFNREYDDYYKGIEYLSSIWILSKCKSLIAGHCGGSRAAVFLNNGLYEYLHIFDLGLYK